jgi:hypothetical protein
MPLSRRIATVLALIASLAGMGRAAASDTYGWELVLPGVVGSGAGGSIPVSSWVIATKTLTQTTFTATVPYTTADMAALAHVAPRVFPSAAANRVDLTTNTTSLAENLTDALVASVTVNGLTSTITVTIVVASYTVVSYPQAASAPNPGWDYKGGKTF